MDETKPPDSTAVEACVSGIFKRAKAALDTDDRRQAPPLAAQAIELSIQSAGIEHPLTAGAFEELARIFTSLKALREAVMCYQEVLAIRVAVFQLNHPETVRALHDLGYALKAAGQFQEALPYFVEALRVGEALFGKEHIAMAVTLGGIADSFFALGKPEAARPFMERCLAIHESVLGKENPNTQSVASLLSTLGHHETSSAASLEELLDDVEFVPWEIYGNGGTGAVTRIQKLARLLSWLEAPAATHAYLEKAVVLCRELFGPGHLETGAALNQLGMFLGGKDKYADAQQYLEEALRIRRNAVGEIHELIAQDLNQLGLLMQKMGRFPEACQYLEEELSILRSVRGNEHSETGECLSHLGTICELMDCHAKARAYLEEALPIQHRSLNGKQELADTLFYLGSACSYSGDFPAGRSRLDEAVAIYREIHGNLHPQIARALVNLAGAANEMKQSAAAREALEEALRIWEALPQIHDTLKEGAMTMLANILAADGEYAPARQLLTQAAASLTKRLGETSQETLRAKTLLGQLLVNMRQFTEARAMLEELLAATEDTCGEEDRHTAAVLCALGVARGRLGDFPAARLVLEKSLALRTKLLGDKDVETAQSLHHLAFLLEDMGDYLGALEHYQKALDIRRMVLSPDHQDYVATLNNIAVLLKTIGKWAEARPFYEEALQSTSRAYGPEHIRTAGAFANAGAFLHAIGELELARDYLERSLVIQQRAGGGDQPGLGSTLHNLASLLTDMGEFTLARQHFKEALARIRSAQYGQPWQEASTLRAMAWLHEKQADHSRALSLLQEAARVQDSILGNAFAAGSERQRKASVIFPFVVLHELLTVVCQHFGSDPGPVCAAFEVLLRRKGIIAEALAAQRDGVLGNRHPELRPALAALSACRAEIARLSFDGPGAIDPAEHQRRIASLRDTRERLEAELAQSIPEIGLVESFRTVDVTAVAAAVPAGHALVEFARFNVCSFRGRAQVEDSRTMRYLAFVLRAGEPESLQLFDLGDAAQIETDVVGLRARIGASSTNRDFGPEEKEDVVHNDRAARALRQAVFDPIRKAVGDCRRLILSPDGVLSFLPFEILPAEENRLLIDEWHFSYLAAARDILARDSRAGATPGVALIAGDPDYDLTVESVAAAHVQQPEVNDSRSARIRRDLDRGFGRFEPLPKARREAERIAELLGVKEHLDAEVTKDLVASCRSPRILHLATHGFFLPSSSDAAASTATLSSDRLAILGQQAENPLLRSGLALAGANTWRKSQPLPAEAGNGILTAEDVTGLDLLDTDLVVLSACETGLGTEDFCEGILGFRRSFGLAGARTIVMSLWKVPDDQTQELMVDFYRRILRGTPKAKALRQAQLEIKARHPESFFWGAFICQGDPGPLQPA